MNSSSSSTPIPPESPSSSDYIFSKRHQKIMYISESFTPNRFDVFKNFLRKNTENFVLIPPKNCIVMPGPKRNKYENPPGLVIAYNSGYIISVGNRLEMVGLGRGGDSLTPYADWVRKKFRSHNCEPTCQQLENTRLLNVLGRIDVPPPQEIFLEELHDFLVVHFNKWKVIYDPEIAPVMAVCRVWGEVEEQSYLNYTEVLKRNNRINASDKISTEEEMEVVDGRGGIGKEAEAGDASQHENAVQRLLPATADCTFRWPTDELLYRLQQHDMELRNDDSNTFMRAFLVIGNKHIVAHKVNSKEELEKAVVELMRIVIHFMGNPQNRWNG